MESQQPLSTLAVIYDADGKEMDREIEVIRHEDGTVSIGRGRYSAEELHFDADRITHESGWYVALNAYHENG